MNRENNSSINADKNIYLKGNQIPEGTFFSDLILTTDQKEKLSDVSNKALEIFQSKTKPSYFVGIGEIKLEGEAIRYLVLSASVNPDLENFLGVLPEPDNVIFVSEQLKDTADKLGIKAQYFIEAQILHEVYEMILSENKKCADATKVDLDLFKSNDPNDYMKYAQYRYKFFGQIIRYYEGLIDKDPQGKEVQNYRQRIAGFNDSRKILLEEISSLENKD